VFLLGPVLALVVVRHWRTALVYGAAILPGLLTLAVWKERGLGHLPILGLTIVRVGASVIPLLGISAPSSIDLNWHQLGQNMAQFREFFWSMRLIEILPFAGVFAVARVSWSKAVFLAGWLGAFILVKGTSERANVQDATFFRLLMPAWPAYLVLACALPLLVPGVARIVRARVAAIAPIEWRSRSFIAGAALVGAVPLLVLAALPTLKDRSIVSEFTNNVIVPAGSDFNLRQRRVGNNVVLTWSRPKGARGNVFYRVYRSPISGQSPIGGLSDYVDGLACGSSAKGAAACQLRMDTATTTRSFKYAEALPKYAGETFRVGMMANWLDDPTLGDVLLVSKPVRVATTR